MKTYQFWQSQLFVPVGLIIAACLGIWLPAPFVIRLAAATVLAAFLPGWLLLRALKLTLSDKLEQLVLAVGLSYGLTILASLGLLYSAGRLEARTELGLLGGMALILTVITRLRGSTSAADNHGVSRVEILFFFIPVVVAAFFSFSGLSYSDYWGDEMNGLLRAISIMNGRSETLFEHTKGPVEILLPAVFGLLAGRFEPFTLRLPFALAYTVGAGAYYLLARRLFGSYVAVLAALILALNGLCLAFGRIVQYQPAVFLMAGLSLLAAYYFYRHGEGKYLGLSLLFVGVGLLAHYDVLFALPPIGYLVWRRYGCQWSAWKSERSKLIGAVVIFLAVAAFFYVPFFLHPHVAQTSSYLARRIGLSEWPANNFDELYVFSLMYNSGYYVALISLLGLGIIAAEIVKLFRNKRHDRGMWLVIVISLILSVLLIVTGQVSFLPLLVWTLLFVLLMGFSSAPAELKVVYVWVWGTSVAYVFFVDHPRTHLLVIFLGWSLLAGAAAIRLISWLKARYTALDRREATIGAITVSLLLFGLFASYEYLLFVDTSIEYIFTYPDHKSPLYWEDAEFPFGSRRPYGAPHRLGWQMINHLYLQGNLRGDWDSNDDGTNLFWYTLGFPRNPCYPRYYFLAEFQQKEEAKNAAPSFSLADYAEIGEVWNRDRLQIKVYEFAPTGGEAKVTVWREPERYTSFVSLDDFHSFPYEEIVPSISNLLGEPAVFRPNPTALQRIADHYGDPRIVNVRDTAALVGYDLDETWTKDGGPIVLTLYWKAVEVINLPYKVFVHLERDDGTQGTPQLWAQSDDFPACGTSSTQQWKTGQMVVDRHVIRLPDTMPPGDYVLRVGLYEPQTGLRMDLLDALGNPQDVSLGLTHVTIQSTSEAVNGSTDSIFNRPAP